MCGIVGFKGKNSSLLKEMIESIRDRGPDDSGSFEDEKFSLGHTRLSILDLSSSGHQPMLFEHLVMVYNGEVYNFKEIRDELIKEGYTFSSDSDSEVILKAYHKWGLKAIDRFIGMFAIAIYDTKREMITLIRDRVGIKPLYYYLDEKSFLFASELEPIMKYKKGLSIEQEALFEFFQFGYISSNLSIFEKCYKLAPGHYAIYDIKSHTLKLQEYWSIIPFFQKPKFQKSEEELIDELEELLIDSFRYRMVSDVPVGVFLSGGIDSSIVSAILQKHYGNIHTFTIGFKEAKYNEATWAKRVAKHLGTNHTELYLDSKKAEEILEHFIDIYDEPFGDSSGIPTTLVSKIAKDNGMKVVLSADGGDEIFCGYSRYWISYGIGKKILSLPSPLRKFTAKMMDIVGVDNASKIFKIKNLAHKYRQFTIMLNANNHRDIYRAILQNASDDTISKILKGKRYNIKNIEFNNFQTPIESMMVEDFHRYLPDDILVKVDRATMFNSIEGREPLLDHRIAEFMAQVPFEYKYRDGKSKYLLRKVLERYIPKELIDRPKMGFGIPMFEWFGAELRVKFEEYFQKDDDLIDMDFARAKLARLKENKPVNINILWFILVYLMWKERYIK